MASLKNEYKMYNPENFDSICINSKDNEAKPVPDLSINHELSANHDISHLYYSNHNNHFVSNEFRKMLNEESSGDSDEVTFVREISKPLLNSSKKKNRSSKHFSLHDKRKWTTITSICFLTTIILASLVFATFLLIPTNIMVHIKIKLSGVFISTKYDHHHDNEIIGCDQISIDDVWTKNFPLLLSEGSARLIKINADDVLDVIMPFGTNVQNKIVCKIFYPDQERCFGGLLALDGVTGDMLWRYDGSGEMYAAVCLEDLNQDGWIDCLGAGRQGTCAAVSGRDGSEIWIFNELKGEDAVMNLYTAQMIDDINGDGIRDFIQVHGGDPVAKPNEMNRLIGKLMILSGKTGHILVSTNVPDYHESYYSPQLLNHGDGSLKILIGTGGETYPGNLFEIDLYELFRSMEKNRKPQALKVYQGPKKGVMTPPVLVDLNRDGYEDIVLCPFGDECVAIDAMTLKPIWKFDAVKNFETYATPAAGYYNDDDVPDIFIQLFVGLGYPVYFYGETLILDGKTGKLLKNLTRSNNVIISSPLTLSVEGKGNDMFLYWLQLCRGHESEINETPFQNLPQYMLSRAHVCQIRFNTTTESLFLIHGKHLINQSIAYGQIYNNENYFHIEHDYVNKRKIQIENFLQKNPKYRPIYDEFLNQLEVTDLSQADESYASNNNGFHSKLVESQRKLEKVDLDDANVHSSLDFTKSVGHSPEKTDYKDDSLNDFQDDSDYEKIRFVRNSQEKLYRYKRHNGPHDGEGLQRLISTGTLAPPLLDVTDKYFNHSMDIIFFTYWSIPKEIVLQTKTEMKCNEKWINIEFQRFRNDSKFFHYDHDHYTTYGNMYCAKKYGRKQPLSNNEKKSTMFNSHFGQLTAFRKRLKCTCSPGRVQGNQRCSRILPLHLQTWPAYLGLGGTAYWNSSFYNLKFQSQRTPGSI